MVKKKTIERRELLLNKMLKKGISANTVRNFNSREWKKVFGGKLLKKDSLKGRKRLIDQIEKNQKQVLEVHYKRREIENKSYQKFLKKETKKIFQPKPGTYKQKTLKLNKEIERKAPPLDSKYRKDKKIYIKYQDEEDFQRQLNIIREMYQVKVLNVNRVKPIEKKYKTFMEEEKFQAFVEISTGL